ncbi:MAG: response regulator transcription factor [Bacteroides sp.]|nr:response regulator transcription factor [Bacteroides sp.]MBD5306463.1 response regulator transcription factor [Bacteroides sp.]
MDKPVRILVVDDEDTLCEIMRLNLEIEGYDADVAHSAEEALELNLKDYSLILLDVMMGEMSGFDMARIMRHNPETAKIPIIFLTAKDTEDDMVAGLGIGGDDYIAKPYSVRNVMARVKALLRRTANTFENNNILRVGTLEVDMTQKICRLDGEPVKMPRKELELLGLLMGNPGKLFSREEILAKIWPEEVIVLNRVVDVNITRLRSKLGAYGKLIMTRSGYGYGFQI